MGVILLDSMVITVNNRELLRDYKSLKEKLMKGEVSEIRVPQKGTDQMIRITLEKKKTPFEDLMEWAQKNGPIEIERPEADIFDYLD